MKPVAKYIISACLLGAIAVMLYELDHARRTFEVQTVRLVTLTDQQLAAANAQLVLTNQIAAGTRIDITNVLTSIVSDLDRQLTMANGRIALSAMQLNNSVETVAAASKQTLDQTTTTLTSVDKVVADPDIPKLIRDARETTAILGSAASHAESTANTIARVAPGIADSVQGTAKSADAISADFHTVTDNFVHPKPKKWYVRVGNIFEEFAARVLGYAL